MGQINSNIQIKKIYNQGMPLNEGVRHDKKYYYSEIWDKNGNLVGENICGKVVLLKEAFINLFSSDIKYRCEIENPQGMKDDKVIIGREYFTENKIQELVKKGVMVNKNTAPVLLKVLENQESLVPCKIVYDKLGWYEINGQMAFLGLNRAIGIDAFYDGGWNDVKKIGSREKWVNMVKEHVLGRPPLELALAVGFASTAIGFMKKYIPSLDFIIIHAVGNSSCGKSTAAELIVSMGSYPKISGRNRSMMMDYSSTEAALIGTLSQISGMPCAIDEASLCSNKNKTLLIYQIASGRERARLSANAELKDAGTWEILIFSTGEHDLLDYCERNVGILVRYISINIDQWTDSAEHSTAIKKIVSNNYGHITEEFAEFLLDLQAQDRIEEVINLYEFWKETLIVKYKEAKKNSKFTDRLAENLAILLFALELGAECIGVEVDIESVANLLVNQCTLERMDDTDIGESAYETLMQEIVKQPDKILPMENRNYPNTIWGVIHSNNTSVLPNGQTAKGTLLILTSVLESILRRNGFNDKNIILKDWRENGILVSHGDRFKSEKKITINGTSADAYEISIIKDREKGHEAVTTFGSSPLARKTGNLLSEYVPENDADENLS